MTTTTTVNALADGVYDALIRDDIPRAMHLSWRLMQRPCCPLQLQAQAVLVHSAASLSMGGDVAIIERNLQDMIKRMGIVLARLPMQGAEAPQVLRTWDQLCMAADSLRVARRPTMDVLAESFGKLGLGERPRSYSTRCA